MHESIDRRQFLAGAAVGAGALAVVGQPFRAAPLVASDTTHAGPGQLPAAGDPATSTAAKKPYRGPNVILVRFGGGVRRRETIDAQHTYSPFFCHELTQRGTLFPQMEISSQKGIETSHGQGTLFILTGKYEAYQDVNNGFLKARFEASVPTVFEYLRKEFEIPPHQALIVNGEDRIDEEFYTFSNHHLFGVNYRSQVLSLYRFKTHLLRRQIAEGKWSGQALEKQQRELVKMESLDYRTREPATTGTGGESGPQAGAVDNTPDGRPAAVAANRPSAEIERFWDRWRAYYGETGLVNPRGDRLLTELTVRAMRELRPSLLMVNYNDPDYVHWGNISHYTRGVAIIDEGIQRLVASVESDEHYRNNTVFVVVPDCGRDSNPFNAVPCQHHFNSRSAREVFALLFGPGIPRGVVVDRKVDQISVAATVGQLMGFAARHAEGPALEEALA